MQRQPGQNIAVSFSTSLLRSKIGMSYGLTYFKLRRLVERQGSYGSFTNAKHLSAFLQLSPPTVKKHIRYCLKKGWLRCMPGKPDQYRIVSMYGLGDRSKANHTRVAYLSDEQLFSITSKNTATLKAIFQEYENERAVGYQKYLKRQQEKGEWSHRDHCVIRKPPRRKKGNGRIKGEPITYFASGRASALTGVSRATAHRYRSRTISHYSNSTGLPVSYVNSKRKILDLVTDVSDLVMEWNSNKSSAIKYFADGNADSPLGQEIQYGYFLICHDGIYLRAASKRIGRVELRRVRVKRKFTAGVG